MIKSLYLSLAFVFAAALSSHGADPLAFVDLRKVFDGYYKTKQADLNLKEEANELQKQQKELLDGFKKNEEDWKKMIDRANDQAISTEERDRSKQAAEKKLMELREMEQTIGQFDRSARAKLAEKQRRKREQVLQEIREVINKRAKSQGVMWVLDTAAESYNQTPIVLYTNGQNDWTETVLTEINSTAPPGLMKRLEEQLKAEERKRPAGSTLEEPKPTK